MDSEILWKLGTPSVAFGPIGTGAHASVEYVDIDSVITAAKILELSIKRFCGAA